jgi:hypothetical protein
MLMFKKLFDGIVDICKPGTDDPVCQFGSQPQHSNQNSNSTAAEEKPNGVWKKAKKAGSAIYSKKS